MAQAHAPPIPQGGEVSAKEKGEFQKLKRELFAIASWGLAPNTWDKIRLQFSEEGNEAQMKAFLFAIK